jgi:hypothetical protein
MRVRELIEHLQTLPQDHSLIGQFHDSCGSWPMVPLEKENIGCVGPNSDLVYIILQVPQWAMIKRPE